jgi:hypothetical protein
MPWRIQLKIGRLEIPEFVVILVIAIAIVASAIYNVTLTLAILGGFMGIAFLASMFTKKTWWIGPTLLVVLALVVYINGF